MAVGDASASPSAKAAARMVTLTSSSSAPAGHLRVQVKYQLEPRGRNKPLSVTFSGASKVSLKHPALIVSLRPVAPLLPPGQHPVCHKSGTRRRCSIRVIAFAILLKIHNLDHFSGALTARELAQIGKIFANPSRRFRPGGYALSATVASVVRHKRQILLAAVPSGLQVGLLLGPAMP
jgi:hypothetical protein